MEIRKTQLEELDTLMNIYAQAKLFMRKTGNNNQWIDGYPSREIAMKDITNGNSYVCTDDDNEIVATFCFIQGEDATYLKIYDGQWLNDRPYGVVHRLAGTGKSKGIGTFCLQWCFDQCKNIRVDTHHDNVVMQNLLKKNGYVTCGIIYIANGTPRIAFQKCL
ncbi:GNAT family N-acetyltransferase [uncultured Bacteroides sp.]|uniref:GNAT family N-acetyltransferase n=1 Tax=uncultured Bacteroides sp. TaxID=162156 RepID=UPI002AA6B78B|nr:GNAT family N-acetyltransferase [uncultured Bacteroides sp.]